MLNFVKGTDSKGNANQWIPLTLDMLFADNAGIIPKDVRLYYDGSDNLIYRCINATHKADTAAETWKIWKLTWTSDNLDRIEGHLEGSVDNRTSLDWA